MTFSNILQINISKNYIDCLKGLSWLLIHNVGLYGLQSINLSNNKIFDLSPLGWALPFLTHLHDIDLSNNCIVTLQPLSVILSTEMADCKIKRINLLHNPLKNCVDLLETLKSRDIDIFSDIIDWKTVGRKDDPFYNECMLRDIKKEDITRRKGCTHKKKPNTSWHNEDTCHFSHHPSVFFQEDSSGFTSPVWSILEFQLWALVFAPYDKHGMKLRIIVGNQLVGVLRSVEQRYISWIRELEFERFLNNAITVHKNLVVKIRSLKERGVSVADVLALTKESIPGLLELITLTSVERVSATMQLSINKQTSKDTYRIEIQSKYMTYIFKLYSALKGWTLFFFFFYFFTILFFILFYTLYI